MEDPQIVLGKAMLPLFFNKEEMSTEIIFSFSFMEEVMQVCLLYMLSQTKLSIKGLSRYNFFQEKHLSSKDQAVMKQQQN